MKASCMATLKTPSFISSLRTSRALKKKMQSNGYGEQQWGKGGAAEEMGRGRAANTTCKHAHLLQQICQEKKWKFPNWKTAKYALKLSNLICQITITSYLFLPASQQYAFMLSVLFYSVRVQVTEVFISENYCLNIVRTTERTGSNVESHLYVEWL